MNNFDDKIVDNSKIEKEVLEFLKSGMAYSDTAIMKNFGLSPEELENIYISLTNQGYLESYADFLKNNLNYDENDDKDEKDENGSKYSHSCGNCGSGGGCGGCHDTKSSSNNSCSGGCSSSDADDDYSKIRVLTDKAFTVVD